MSDDDSFVSRWSRRKAQVRDGVVPAEPLPDPPPAVLPPAPLRKAALAERGAEPEPAAPALPTL